VDVHKAKNSDELAEDSLPACYPPIPDEAGFEDPMLFCMESSQHQ
jgi:hypothetical protein